MGTPAKKAQTLDANFMWARLLHAQKQAPPPEPRVALTVPQAARYLSCSIKFIRRLIARRELRYVKVGRRFVIATAELDKWLDANQRTA
jgi:excisionase family DNA binding protein